MRINLLAEFLKPPVTIRKDYRRDITKFIKNAICLGDKSLYQQYYGDKKQNKPKPFTFSVSFDVKEDKGNNFIIENPLYKLYFSSFEPVVCIAFYNGVLQLKNNCSIFGDTPQEIKNIFLQRDTIIMSEKTAFRTLSPILVRKIEDGKGKGFLRFDDEEFLPNLKKSIVIMADKYLYKKLSESDLNISLSNMKATPIRNYGGEIGNTGFLEITAPLDVQKMLYDAGIGAKRSQGFGMLEVVG